ncbi:MAG: response regulator transcription factor [Bacteroidales bacterium]|jgi:two-component system alkaline phosphatase synthesis response regulator PhoP|nr:response regulator transcription factor [Bacteroidales bacterium]MDZ4058706.1 response regulator transcription factor [Bacteroidales bacterium]
MEKRRVLIVDDEEDLCEILSFNLKSAGFETDVAFSAEEAYAKIKNNYDLLLLDVMMGAISGFKLAELIREDYPKKIPIIFITAKDNENDKLKGFNLGADDYISKPFSVKEVIARVNAVLSRVSPAQEKQISGRDDVVGLIDFKRLTINRQSKIVKVNDIVIKLTKKEFEILYILASQPHKIFSRSNILDMVWKNESYVLDRTVDVHIARLRKKIEPYANTIVNRSGYGYCFDPDEGKLQI